jgi:hypothetical protein
LQVVLSDVLGRVKLGKMRKIFFMVNMSFK